MKAEVVPPLTVAELEKLMAQALPYQWMTILVSTMVELKDKPLNVESWREDKFVLAVWKVLHDKVRARRQGRATMYQKQAAPPQMPKQVVNSLGDTSANKPRKCFCRGEEGHWAADGPKKGGNGKVQQVGEARVWVSAKRVAWDMSKAPPTPCIKCGQMHWSRDPVPGCPGVAGRPEGH